METTYRIDIDPNNRNFTQDAINKLIDDVKRDVIEICAKVAEIHHVPRPDNEYQNGYNEAVRTVAKKIRELK